MSAFTTPVLSPEDTNRMVLANLRLVREYRGLTAKQAAPRVGLARATVIGHETGVRRVTMNRLAVYARAYGVSVRDLFDPDLRARLATRAAA